VIVAATNAGLVLIFLGVMLLRTYLAYRSVLGYVREKELHMRTASLRGQGTRTRSEDTAATLVTRQPFAQLMPGR
jgi:hypothetical protein